MKYFWAITDTFWPGFRLWLSVYRDCNLWREERCALSTPGRVHLKPTDAICKNGETIWAKNLMWRDTVLWAMLIQLFRFMQEMPVLKISLHRIFRKGKTLLMHSLNLKWRI